MNATNQFTPALILLATLLIPASSMAEALLGGKDLDPGAGELTRIVVPPTDVAIDGEERQQLGRSLADTLIAGLLQTGRFRVVDSADLALMSAETADNMLAQNLIKNSNADVYLVSRLVGEFDYFHFTIREIDARSKEVVDVHQFSHKGSREEVYDLVPQFLAKIGAPTALAAPRQRVASNPLQKPARIKEQGSTYYPLKQSTPPTAPPTQEKKKFQVQPGLSIPAPAPAPASSYVPSPTPRPAPAPKPTPQVNEQPKPIAPPGTTIHQGIAVERVPVGTIQLVNVPWKFCVVKPYPEASLETYDSLEILTGMEETTFAKLYISKFDSGRIIANYERNNWNRVLFPGETVYAWQELRQN